MADIVIPPGLRHARASFRYIEQAGVARGAFNGVAQVTGYGGDRVGATIEFTPHGGRLASDLSLLAQLRAFTMQVKKQNRIWLTDASYTRRGSFPAAELFSNSDFASGASGWSVDAGALSAADGVMRLTASQVISGSNVQFRQNVVLNSYAPYVLRSVVLDGAQSAGLAIGPSLSLSASSAVSDYQLARGYRVASGVSGASGNFTQFPVVFSNTSGFRAGAYVLCPFTSLSRCMLADGGGTLTTRSRELDNAAWTKSALLTVGANTETAPDGTVTAEGLTPTTANAVHYISQNITVTSSAQDINIRGMFNGGGYNFILLALTENTGVTQSFQVFNLQTGAVGSSTSLGANWSNLRAAIVNMGNGWYYCSLVVRKTNAATSVTGYAYVQNADSGSPFAGNGTSFVRAADVCISPSGVHARTTTSTSAAVAAESQRGSALYVKGLPASQAGLLLIGDWVEIDSQIVMVTASLDSDAAGLGHLQFSPPLARAVADNTPIIVHRPMGRFMFSGESASIDLEPGVFGRSSIELEGAPLA